MSLVLLLTACLLVQDGDLSERLDLDQDGIERPADCDDDDSAVGLASTFFVDGDQDGWGTDATVTQCFLEAAPGQVRQRSKPGQNVSELLKLLVPVALAKGLGQFTDLFG